jgi:hypothetical protein
VDYQNASSPSPPVVTAQVMTGAPVTTSGVKVGAPMDLTGLYTVPVKITNTTRTQVQKQHCLGFPNLHEAPAVSFFGRDMATACRVPAAWHTAARLLQSARGCPISRQVRSRRLAGALPAASPEVGPAAHHHHTNNVSNLDVLARS